MKYQEVYLKAYQDGREARTGPDNYFRFYNTKCPHQALGYRTPDKVFTSTLVEANNRGMVESLTLDSLENSGTQSHMSISLAPNPLALDKVK